MYVLWHDDLASMRKSYLRRVASSEASKMWGTRLNMGMDMTLPVARSVNRRVNPTGWIPVGVLLAFSP